MSPSVSTVLLVVGALLHCGLPSATAVRANYTELFSSFDLKQRIAYRIGQVECLKTLLSDNATQYGLGALHRGDYNTDITRFSIKQRIAFLHGQVQCLRIHLSVEGETIREQQQKGLCCKKYSTHQQKPITSSVTVYLDCKDAYQKGRTTSGLYTINPDNQTAFQVYCDMGHKWRRMDSDTA